MSMPPEPPQRLAEILLEIFTLSDSTRTSQSESDTGSPQSESSDTHRVNEPSKRTDEKGQQLERTVAQAVARVRA